VNDRATILARRNADDFSEGTREMTLVGEATIVRGVDDTRAAAQHALCAEDAALDQV
jgi:hypothetical protein